MRKSNVVALQEKAAAKVADWEATVKARDEKLALFQDTKKRFTQGRSYAYCTDQERVTLHDLEIDYVEAAHREIDARADARDALDAADRANGDAVVEACDPTKLLERIKGKAENISLRERELAAARQEFDATVCEAMAAEDEKLRRRAQLGMNIPRDLPPLHGQVRGAAPPHECIARLQARLQEGQPRPKPHAPLAGVTELRRQKNELLAGLERRRREEEQRRGEAERAAKREAAEDARRGAATARRNEEIRAEVERKERETEELAAAWQERNA